MIRWSSILHSVLATLLLSAVAAPVLAAPVCDGDPLAQVLGIQAPAPPGDYDLPDGAVLVSTTEDLMLALKWNAVQNATPMDIVLEPGLYEATPLLNGFLSIHGSHRLWAQVPGHSILKFGLHIGADANPHLEAGVELHGLRFDIDYERYGAKSNPFHTSSAVLTWGTGRNVLIEDCWFEGNGAIDRGIDARQADGLKVHRVVVSGFKRYGVFTAAGGPYGWSTSAELEDLQVSTVGDNAWARSLPETHTLYDPAYPHFDPADPYSDTQELGIWIGLPARLSRARVRDIARGGVVAAGETVGAVLEDLDVDQIGWREGEPVNPTFGAGLYFDNTTIDSVYRRFCVGPDVLKGLISEWDNNTFPRGIRNLVEDGLVQSSWLGIMFDQGTVDSFVRNVYFRNASWAGLTLYNNVWPNDHQSTIDVLYEDLHDAGLPLTSCLVTAYHPKNNTPCHVPPPNPQNP